MASQQQVSSPRFTLISSKSLESVVAALESAVGHPNVSELLDEIRDAKSYAEMEAAVGRVAGKTGLMELARFDLGAVLQKVDGLGSSKIVRFLIGNPLIMQKMVRHVPDAGSYAPVTVLIDERPDGVHLSYDKMAAFLAPYGNAEALKVALELDAKIEVLLQQAAS